MKIVVTGGAGFIGANLCRRLGGDARVTEVVALDNLSTGSAANLDGTSAKLVEGSILDAELLDDVFAGAHAVVHLAARPSVPLSVEDPVTSHLMNATGTMEVLQGARRAGNVACVVASSSSVYGSNPPLPAAESLAPRPKSPYAAAKLATETYTLAWQATYGLPAIAFRFFNVFGPLQPAGHAYAAVMPAFISKALAGEPVHIHGDGQQTRDFTYIDSVTDVLATAAIDQVSSETPVNLAFGGRVSLLEVVDLLSDILGEKVAVNHGDPRPGDVPHSQARHETLDALFPNAEVVSLRDGLERTVQWWKAMQ